MPQARQVELSAAQEQQVRGHSQSRRRDIYASGRRDGPTQVGGRGDCERLD
jgi:hypothetical protein